MGNPYTALALSFRRWHQRMSRGGWKRWSPESNLSLLHGLNTFSLLLLGVHSLPGWLVLGLPWVVGAGLYWWLRTLYAAHPETPYRANWTDAVPGLREFALVYAYLLFTLVLFVACGFAAAR